MSKVKITEIAEYVAKNPKEVLEKAKELGLDVKNTSSSVSEEIAEILAHYVTTGENTMPQVAEPKASKTAKRTATKKSNTQKSTTAKAPTQSTKASQAKKASKESTSSTAKKPTTTKRKTPKDIVNKPIAQDVAHDIKQDAINNDVSSASSPMDISISSEKPHDKHEDTIKKDSTLAQRKMGFHIVKKTPAEAPKDTTSKKPKAYALSLQELMGQDFGAEAPIKKPKKAPKKAAISHKGNEQKIALFDKNFDTHRSAYDEEQEIMLFDFSEREIVDEEKEQEVRQVITERVKIQRKNPWLSDQRSISRSKRKKPQKAQNDNNRIAQSAISIPNEIRVYEFAERAGIPLTDVIKVLFGLGLMVTKNDFLEHDAIEILAEEFHIAISLEEQHLHEQERVYDEASMLARPPVVTIMGHVDHGKTTLLDYIRNSRVASSEAGGITQHIGAYMVEKNNTFISFIDTPGHEAFSHMRGRGAQVTDIAIIVIAADDGVKPQTIEALQHAKAANVQIIIAMNKMDKENANTDKLKAECAELGFTPSEWGGEYEFVPISAKSGEGVDTLLETIILHAELLELKASYNAQAQGVVLEGSMQKGKGPVGTIIIQQGTLKVGDPMYAGVAYGRVRSMVDDRGREISELTPSSVALVSGFSQVPSAGSMLYALDSDIQARDKAQQLASHLRQKELSKSTKVSFDELSDMVAQGQLTSIPIIMKADTQGSLEALTQSLQALSNNEVSLMIIGSGVGGISESDVDLAAASANSIIIGFGLRPTGIVKAKAKEHAIEIKTYSVIYDVINDMKSLISGLMSPIIKEEETGQAEVRNIFSIAKVGTIAGCMVLEGKILRGVKIRLIRDGIVIHTGSVASLKRFKDDAKEVAKGYECGIMLDNYNDIRIGDVFESFIEVQTAQSI